MSTPTILLFMKAHVAGYTRRDGVHVRPHERKGDAANPAQGQLALFMKPHEARKPAPLPPGQIPADMDHHAPASDDPRKKFYVTMIREPGPRQKVARLAGSFDKHEDALAHVDRARDIANELDPRSHFDAFGTAGITSDNHKPGVLNERLGIRADTEPSALLTKTAKADSPTETPEFKRWFGDSKVVDEDGKPLVVYHGTNAKFTEFSKEKQGSNTGFDNTRLGFYFIADKKQAEDFAKKTSGGEHVVDAYLSIQKPLNLTKEAVFSNKDQASTLYEIFTGERLDPDEALEAINDDIGLGDFAEISEAMASDHAKEILERDGYDGIISHFGGGKLEYVAFKPEQIKSASGNSGAFDPKSKDMTKSMS